MSDRSLLAERYPADVLGITPDEQMTDIDKSLEASYQTALYYQSDMVELMPPIGATLAPAGYRHLKWAGHGLSASSGWQFVDEEVMKPEEYDELIYDPSDFIVRKYWLRAYSRLAGLAGLAPLREGQGYFAGPFAFAAFGTPAGIEALEALREAGAAGNVPLALLSVGTPDDVRAYCKNLIDSVGRDGGFILGASGQTEDVKIENVKAMVDFTKEYGA